MMDNDKIHIITILLCVLFLPSCKKEHAPTINETDGLVFGHYYGMCQEETCCPDCADQGGLVVMLMQNGDVETWRIDQSKAAVPQYLHAFMDSVNVSISLLSNE